jgi:hypothetical protein
LRVESIEQAYLVLVDVIFRRGIRNPLQDASQPKPGLAAMVVDNFLFLRRREIALRSLVARSDAALRNKVGLAFRPSIIVLSVAGERESMDAAVPSLVSETDGRGRFGG